MVINPSATDVSASAGSNQTNANPFEAAERSTDPASTAMATDTTVAALINSRRSPRMGVARPISWAGSTAGP